MSLFVIQETHREVLLALLIFILLFKVFRIGSRESSLPPGPLTLPILGNAHLLPSRDLHLK
jgi:hypothetical protein